jgi:hypothetical protein
VGRFWSWRPTSGAPAGEGRVQRRLAPTVALAGGGLALFGLSLMLLLVALGVGRWPSAGPADRLPDGLAVEGFEALPPQAQHEVATALASLPPEHIAVVALLRFDPVQHLSGRSLRREATVSLGYRLWTEQLGQEHRIAGVTALEETLVHEVGHQVAFADAGRLEKRFDEAFWLGRLQRYNRPVADAGLDSIEDFAVTYSQYRYNLPYLEACCPERAAFMRSEVFGGRTWPSPTPG